MDLWLNIILQSPQFYAFLEICAPLRALTRNLKKKNNNKKRLQNHNRSSSSGISRDSMAVEHHGWCVLLVPLDDTEDLRCHLLFDQF